MDMLTTDISSLGYKAVKEKVDKIDVNEVHNSEDLIKIIDILNTSDISIDYIINMGFNPVKELSK